MPAHYFSFIYKLALLCLLIFIHGCAAQRLAPVVERGSGSRDPIHDKRTVAAGDTLYSIAWETGRDYRQLAQWNGIAPPYIIIPGQQIIVRRLVRDRHGKTPKLYTVVAGESLYQIAGKYNLSYRDLAQWNHLQPPYVIHPGQQLRLSDDGQATQHIKAKTAPSAAQRAAPVIKPLPQQGKKHSGPPKKWVWPARGKLLNKFKGRGNDKGIDIAGRKGQKIAATAGGSVVYQGSGLRGYGKLIIIKHSDDYLSAYAHCDQVLVKEGDMIKQGQTIAKMGNTGANRIKLHFEIRYRGNPVDPLKYLGK